MRDENGLEFETGEEAGQETTAAPRMEKKESTRLVTVIQILVCVAVLAGAVGIKANGGPFYKTVRDWYFAALNDSIIAEEQLDDVEHRVIDLWSSFSRAGLSSSDVPPSSAAGESGQSASSQEENSESKVLSSAPDASQANSAGNGAADNASGAAEGEPGT